MPSNREVRKFKENRTVPKENVARRHTARADPLRWEEERGPHCGILPVPDPPTRLNSLG